MACNLLGTLLGGVLAIVAAGLTQVLIARRERKQQVLIRQLDRFLALEELVGEVVEMVQSYQPKMKGEVLRDKLQKLAVQAGTFHRFQKVSQAIRDLHHCASVLWSQDQRHEDDRETRKELEEKRGAFVKACDEALENTEVQGF